MCETIARAEVATALDVTERSLQSWERDLGLGAARVEGARPPAYEISALLRWLLEQGRESSALQKARIRDVESRAALRELEVARLRGETVTLDQAAWLLRDSLTMGATALKAAPRKLARKWARKLKVREAEARQLIEGVVEDVKTILRDAAARAPADLEGVAANGKRDEAK